jgi:hypothetical protein
MKNLLLLLSLVLLVSCGGGKGGSSGGNNPTPENPIDNIPTNPNTFVPNPNHSVVNYALVVTGCDGAMFDSIALVNYASVDEFRSDWPGVLDASGTSNISLTGREIKWNVENIGSCPVTMTLYRGVYVETFQVVNPTETKEIFY